MSAAVMTHGRLAALAGLLALVTRLPFRSEALFDWDSANFALALDDIDIAAHRPHPPGYLGYVLGGRAFQWLGAGANDALVWWNIVMTAVALFVTARFAAEASGDDALGRRAGLMALVLMATSPLLWFQSSIAEIYPSEMTGALLVAYFAWRSIMAPRGSAIYGAMIALAVTIAFKVSAAVLISPLVLYAWMHQDPERRRRSAAWLAVAAGTVVAAFLAIEPRFFLLLIDQFRGATETSSVTAEADVFENLNQNARDTLTAAATAFGILFTLTLVMWAAVDRRLPRRLTASVLALWTVPWIVLLLFVHIGKSGYFLPLIPPGVIVLSGWISRVKGGAVLLAAGVVSNVVHFALVSPFSPEAMGAPLAYRDKSFAQRALSDLAPLALRTAHVIDASDRDVATLTEDLARSCPVGGAVIVAGADGLDWRRALYYAPTSTSVRLSEDGRVLDVARGRRSVPLTPDGMTVDAACSVWWLTNETLPLPETMKPIATRRHSWWMTPAGRLRIHSGGIEYEP
jgi:hypothetical protein